ncbi:MAG: DMT family transporter [Candidatus Roizmanbacteria bacterium]|nr:DMT family transporter [Candidatus Roizmanbacteria bacterium]
MNWLIFACISIVTVSIATILERVLMKDTKSDPVSYAITFQFTVALISFLFAILFGKFVLPPLGTLWPRFVLSSFLWAGATVFGFQAIKRLSAGEVTILTTTSSVVSIALGIFFLKELFNIQMALGALLIFIAIWIVNSAKATFHSREGIIFALLSAVCAGAAVVNDAVILKGYEAFSYTAIMSLLPGVILVLLFPRSMKKVAPLMNKKTIGLFFVFCLFYSLQAITYYLAFENNAPVSQLSPFMKSSIVSIVILEAIFLRERKNMGKKIVAAILVTAGVILLG